MKFPALVRYLAGYLIGFAVFIVAIPYCLYAVARTFDRPVIANHTIIPVFSIVLGSIGVFFILWSNAVLLIRGKGGPTDAFNVAISPRTKRLVVTGPYKYTRNPMVFGAFSLYFALAFLWNSVPALIVLVMFYIFAVKYLKATEEKRLLKDFGPEYEEYRKRVAMIVPWVLRRGK